MKDGLYWVTSERASLPKVIEICRGQVYCIGESRPLEIVHLERRGWVIHGPVQTPPELGGEQ